MSDKTLAIISFTFFGITFLMILGGHAGLAWLPAVFGGWIGGYSVGKFRPPPNVD